VHKKVDNYLLVIKHDQYYTSGVISILFHKTGRGEGRGAYSREGISLNFVPFEGRLYEGSAYLRGGANSRIYIINSRFKFGDLVETVHKAITTVKQKRGVTCVVT